MSLPPFRVRVLPRTLRFLRPAGTSRGVYVTRDVWYVAIVSADASKRFAGVGECAPLHDLSCDYSADYGERLRAVCAEVEKAQRLDTERLRHLPSMLFGLETAFRSAEASLLRGDYRLLFPSTFTEGRRGIAINGLVWMGTHEEMCQRMEEKLAAGFACVKLKIGAIDFESEMELVRRLRRRFSPETVELRVDANGAFAPAEAPRRLEQLSRYGIHSIEQPIRQGQWEAMARLCADTPLPIALDEELIGVHTPERKAALLDTIRPQYVILKPTLHGGLSGAEEWMSLARQRGIGYWATSALESNVGLNAIAQWCAVADPDTTLPQGLGTGQLFERNFEGIPLSLEGDRIWYGDKRQRDFLGEVSDFRRRWLSPEPTMTAHTSGSTGAPKPMEVEKTRMKASAELTLKALGLQKGDTALLAMPLQHIAGQMVAVRAFVGGLKLLPVAPSSHPYATLHEPPRFAALTAMQVHETMKTPHERALLRRTARLIIGGGAVPPKLEERLRSFPNPVWATYGMTETLSHIALRRLNGPEASDAYTPMPGVEVTLSPEGTLCIYAPAVCPAPLATNDLGELLPDGTFRVTGRRDNVICSGGVKLQAEEIERKLQGTLAMPFLVTAVPDERLGQTVTLLYEGAAGETERIGSTCRACLSRYEVPRRYFAVPALPLTATGKPARAKAAALAKEILEKLAR